MNYHIVTYGWELGLKLWLQDVSIFLIVFIPISLIVLYIINKQNKNKKGSKKNEN